MCQNSIRAPVETAAEGIARRTAVSSEAMRVTVDPSFLLVLTVAGLGACTPTAPGTRTPETTTEPGDVEANDGEEASAPDAPLFLGLRMSARLGALRERHPGLSVTPDERGDTVVGQLPLTVEGVELRTQLSFYEGRLGQVSCSAPSVSIAHYEALVGQLERELGPGQPGVCGHDGDIPLTEYLGSGRGSLTREWQSERIWARATLVPTTTTTLMLHVHMMWRPLTDRHIVDDFKGGRRKRVTAGPRAEPFGPSACPEVGASPPDFQGIPYGSSAADAARQLGAEVTRHGTRVTAAHRIGGVDGELTLSFWDDCMASVFFVAPGTRENYRAIQTELLGALGSPERRERCSPTGAEPTAEEVAATHGSFQTLWRDERIRGSVRLSAITPREAPQVVVDLSFLPLGRRAPEINFAGH